MATEIEIINSALSKIRGRTITTIDDNSTEARLCKSLYPRVRDAALRKHSWRFAIKRVELALLVDPPEYGFANAFELPSDCIKIIETDSYADDEWAQEGGKVLSDRTEFFCTIVYKETDASKYDTVFAEYLATELASQLALPLTSSPTIAAGMREAAKEALREARSYSAQERGSIQQPEATTWLTARY